MSEQSRRDQQEDGESGRGRTSNLQEERENGRVRANDEGRMGEGRWMRVDRARLKQDRRAMMGKMMDVRGVR
jgi:hypothetical protein